ncbi:2-oxoacid:acceptor oxidoreductase family protein [Mesoterricola silvestris]|uniref:Pyruvate ferredoxin oxidoreductase n=1 Tax=Mesoterricola silvestris TaxID=2927979 RepID=A0AA48GV61_9BACT|nr:2-oxoacid:acceptor oxidoreductase family protein [Mesoterricola silvestris]BDU74642.1 pyruvate ferredoxin oxidoreductase [Mesoterricola silvestris]
MSHSIRQLCLAPEGHAEVLQGNIAFAVGCVRSGVHSADGYPGTPSSEVIDRGLAQVQDLITVGWSVNEAAAAAVGFGHTLAGRDCVVTMKIPGLFQAGDIFTSGSGIIKERGALVYFIASDFTPSSTQHLVDPRPLFKSCFVPVLEPRNHQEMLEAPGLAVEVARAFNTQVVVMPSGALCHSEGLVRLNASQTREPVKMAGDLHGFNVLPSICSKSYLEVMATRMPGLVEMVEKSPLNRWDKGSGKVGVVTYGVCDLYLREVMEARGLELDVLSLAFSNPLPLELIKRFCATVEEVVVIEDGYRHLQEAMEQAGLKVRGKLPYSPVTEWTPALIAGLLGLEVPGAALPVAGVMRPPLICPGCPYRLMAQELSYAKSKGTVEAIFGDIGCNALLYFMDAMDTGLAMGASEGKRTGYVLSRPEQASKCVSIIGDSTECHSGMDATRNAIYRNVPGVKIILDNEWTAMTGGQPSPTSPGNLAGQANRFDLPASLAAHGAKVEVIGAYERKTIRATLRRALAEAAEGVFTTIVVRDGACLKKIKPSRQRVQVDPEACRKCDLCLICPGIAKGAAGVPEVTNLCSGCGGHEPACSQMCPTKVLKPVSLDELGVAAGGTFPAAPAEIPGAAAAGLPRRLSLAIRGVGGQGNLFFGRVLTQLAMAAGYGERNIVKGDTHGMAQMGGPVISTFGCGDVVSPVQLPGTVDCLIVMEKSEVLRPGFLDLLRPGGTILLAGTRILPEGMAEEAYPTDAQLQAILRPYHLIEVDLLEKAIALGDPTGKIANVVLMGILSTLEPFDRFPAELWWKALQAVNPKPAVWAANYAAFNAGRASSRPVEAR